MPITPLSKSIQISCKLDLKSKVNKIGKKITNAIIFFSKFICMGEKYLACCLQRWQAYVHALAAPKAEKIPIKI